MNKRPVTVITISIAALALVACGGESKRQFPRQVGINKVDPAPKDAEQETLFGPGGLKVFGDDKKEDGGAGIGVNAFLWRASLDTLSFMPLASADPFGGVIITDWRVDPAAPGERVKTTVYILDRRLRADALRVSVFRQVRDAGGGWVDATVDETTPRQLENAILTRARELRIASVRS